MGLWTCVIDEDSDAAGCALLLDSVTMRPLALPLFRSERDAESFERYAAEQDYPELRSLSAYALDRLHTAWLAARAVDAEEARDG